MAASTLALLFIGAVAAAAISGSVGFGGALLLLPLLTRTVGTAVGVPVLTVAQLVGNLSRGIFGLRAIAWKPAVVFLIAAIPTAVIGSWCFIALPKSAVVRIIGVTVLVLVTLKWRGLLEFEMNLHRLAEAGAVVGFVSGLVGSAGPLGAAAFLALNLEPSSYIATEATTAVAMHACKLMVYGRFVPFDRAAWKLALLLSVAMIVGTWIGKKTVERLSVARFRVVVGVLLLLLALQMIVFG